LRFKVQGLGFSVCDVMFTVYGSGSGALGFGLRVEISAIRVWGAWSMLKGLGFRSYVLGFGVQGFG